MRGDDSVTGDPTGREAPEPAGALNRRLQEVRPRLRRMVELRLDPGLARRLDVSDVVQEALVDVSRRLSEYRSNPTMSFYLWVRFLTMQKLLELRRRHRSAMRDVGREVAEDHLEVSVSSLCGLFAAAGPSPRTEAARQEQGDRLQQLLEEMPAVEREILTMRHFEAMNNREVAEALGVSEATTSRGYLRALERLRGQLDERPRP